MSLAAINEESFFFIFRVYVIATYIQSQLIKLIRINHEHERKKLDVEDSQGSFLKRL